MTESKIINLDNKKVDYAISDKRIAGLIFLIVFKLSIEFEYYFVLKDLYYGSTLMNFEYNFAKGCIGWFLIIVIYFCLEQAIRKPSDFFVTLYYYIVMVPLSVMYAFSNQNSYFFIVNCLLFMVMEIIVKSDIKKVDFRFNNLTNAMIICFYITTVIVYVDLFKEHGMFNFNALHIFSIYNMRGTFSLNKYIGYLFRIQFEIITPFFIVRTLKKEEFIKCGFFVTLQLIAYLYAAQKIILFSIPMIIVIYYFATKIKDWINVVRLFIILTAVVVLLSSISRFFMLVSSLFIRRVLIIPAILKFAYFEFFNYNIKTGFSGTLWGKLLGKVTPYPNGVGVTVGTDYFRLTGANENTGFVGEGYYMFGLLGIFLVYIVFICLLYIIDVLAIKNGNAFAITLSVFPIYLINDTGIADRLMMGDLFVLVVICICYSIEKDTIGIKKKGK